jgi:hypothetical protein
MKCVPRVCRIGVLLVLVAALPSPCQTARPSRGGSRSPRTSPGDVSGQQPLASFKGTVHEIDKKALTLEEADANTMQFVCSRKTHYYDGSKEIKASTLKPGDHVTVETKRFRDGELEAVTVRLEKADAQ